jgi:hypothetical protein
MWNLNETQVSQINRRGTFDSGVSNKASTRYKAARIVHPLQKLLPDPRKYAFALAKKIFRYHFKNILLLSTWILSAIIFLRKSFLVVQSSAHLFASEPPSI